MPEPLLQSECEGPLVSKTKNHHTYIITLMNVVVVAEEEDGATSLRHTANWAVFIAESSWAESG